MKRETRCEALKKEDNFIVWTEKTRVALSLTEDTQENIDCYDPVYHSVRVSAVLIVEPWYGDPAHNDNVSRPIQSQSQLSIITSQPVHHQIIK